MSNTKVVDFKTVYSGDKGHDWVLLAPAGESYTSTQTWHRIDRLRPREGMSEDERAAMTNQAMIARWEVIGPAYDAWRSGLDIPDNGTPLAAWAGATLAEQDVLRRMGIKTVEDVAAMSDSAISKMPFPNARKLPKLAADYLAGKDTADLQAEMAALRERNEAMEAMIEEMAKQPKARKQKEAER